MYFDKQGMQEFAQLEIKFYQKMGNKELDHFLIAENDADTQDYLIHPLTRKSRVKLLKIRDELYDPEEREKTLPVFLNAILKNDYETMTEWKTALLSSILLRPKTINKYYFFQLSAKLKDFANTAEDWWHIVYYYLEKEQSQKFFPEIFYFCKKNAIKCTKKNQTTIQFPNLLNQQFFIFLES